MLRDERLELRDQIGVALELELGGDPFLDDGQAQLLETPDLGLGENLVSEVRQRRSTPERQRLTEQLGPFGRFALTGPSDESLEPQQVELFRLEPKPVAGRPGLEQFRPDRLAELGDEVLERGPRRPRRALAPEELDQPLGRNHVVHVEQEQREQGSLLLSGQRYRHPVVEHLERPEDPEVPARDSRGARYRSLQGRELVRQSGRNDLKHPLEPLEVLQPLLPEIPKPDLGKRVVAQQLTRRTRDEDLTAGAGGADPGGPVDPEADVAVRSDDRLARVDADPYSHLRGARPLVPDDRALRLHRGRHCVFRPMKCGEEAVPLRVDLTPAGFLDDRLEELPVLRDDLCVLVAELFDQSGRPLHVGEEKRDRSTRELGHSDGSAFLVESLTEAEAIPRRRSVKAPPMRRWRTVGGDDGAV